MTRIPSRFLHRRLAPGLASSLGRAHRRPARRGLGLIAALVALTTGAASLHAQTTETPAPAYFASGWPIVLAEAACGADNEACLTMLANCGPGDDSCPTTVALCTLAEGDQMRERLCVTGRRDGDPSGLLRVILGTEQEILIQTRFLLPPLWDNALAERQSDSCTLRQSDGARLCHTSIERLAFMRKWVLGPEG